MDRLGAHPARSLAVADVFVVNTCTVTAEADRDARAAIRRARRINPQIRVVVTGCYAQRAPAEIAALPGVAAVVGNSHKDQVASTALRQTARHRVAVQRVSEASTTTNFVPLASLQRKPASEADDNLDHSADHAAFSLTGDIFAHSDFTMPSLPAAALLASGGGKPQRRTRPSLKIQDGCANRCTFCVIPYTRGNSRSLPRGAVLDQVTEFVEAGGKELVLSGINLGRWGRDLDSASERKHRFEDLLAEILETTSLPRLRISSVEPMDWSDDLIALMRRWGAGEHPRLARHAHLPLQSGSDRTLRKMHRRYRPWHYADRLKAIRAAVPDAAIGADVMVGFPGETEADFQESYSFIAAQPFTYLHLFPFSARPGTPAWQLHRESPVAGVAVRERMAALQALIGPKNQAFRARFVGRQLSAVTLAAGESAQAARQTNALTDNFLPVEFAGRWPANSLLSVQIQSLTANGLSGVVCDSQNTQPPLTG